MDDSTEPTPSTSTEPAPQRAVWFFVAATFVFTVPTIFAPGAEWWIRIAAMVVGFALIAVGGVYLGRELNDRRARRATEGPRGS